jgi:hypothetical protein
MVKLDNKELFETILNAYFKVSSELSSESYTSLILTEALSQQVSNYPFLDNIQIVSSTPFILIDNEINSVDVKKAESALSSLLVYLQKPFSTNAKVDLIKLMGEKSDSQVQEIIKKFVR